MPKLIDTVKTYKKRILVVLGAIAALAVAVTATKTDDDLCQKWDNCKDAYAAGSEPAPVSPTTVPAGQ
jgi:hypothetical protein